jgi:hypothetical protein
MSEGLEGFGGADLVIPERVMSQPTSGEISGLIDNKTGAAAEMVAGLFIDKRAKISYGKDLDVVLLKASKKRVLFFSDSGIPEEKEKKGRKCWSVDGIKPAENVPPATKQADICADCKYFNSDLEYHLLLLDVKESLAAGAPIVFNFVAKKTSMSPTRMLITAIVNRKGKDARDFQATMRTAATTNTKGNFRVVNFGAISPIEDETLKAIVEEGFLTYCDAAASVEEEAGEEMAESRF